MTAARLIGGWLGFSRPHSPAAYPKRASDLEAPVPPCRGFFLEPGHYSRVCSIVRLYAIRASVKQPNLNEILEAPVRIESGAFHWANGSARVTEQLLCTTNRERPQAT